MAKKKLAFVDHNYHKKTRSGDFLREIFSEYFIIDDYWWSLSEETKLIKYLKNYENIFFFQTFFFVQKQVLNNFFLFYLVYMHLKVLTW